MMAQSGEKPDNKTQAERFKQAARDLGCDESEARFDERLKKVAAHRPDPDASAVKPPRKPAKKKPGG